MTVIPIVIGALGTIPKRFVKRLLNLEIMIYDYHRAVAEGLRISLSEHCYITLIKYSKPIDLVSYYEVNIFFTLYACVGASSCVMVSKLD